MAITDFCTIANFEKIGLKVEYVTLNILKFESTFKVICKGFAYNIVQVRFKLNRVFKQDIILYLSTENNEYVLLSKEVLLPRNYCFNYLFSLFLNLKLNLSRFTAWSKLTSIPGLNFRFAPDFSFK